MLEYDAYNRAKETKVLLDGLAYANGVAVSKENDFVLVVETARYRVWRYWLSGEKGFISVLFKPVSHLFNEFQLV